ncbi:MAG: response regulator [Treponema sp.]|nr:response regulator [Treponema sp.]
MSAISQSFLISEEMGTLIRNALMMAGMFLDVSHIALARLDIEKNLLLYEYEWYNRKHDFPHQEKQTFPFAPGEMIYDTFIIRGDVYLACDDVEEKPEMSPRLKSMGVRAFICTPVTVYGKFWGFLGFDQCLTTRKWDAGDIQLARLIASALAGLIIRFNAEDELRRMSSIVNGSPQYISWITPDGRFKYLNQGVCNITGYTREELMERGMAVLFDGETFRTILDEYIPYILEKGYMEKELSIIGRNGETRILDFSAFPTDASRMGIGIIAQDITEKRQLEKDLVAARDLAEQSNRAKSNFLSRMSHEMRTPMNAIIGMTTIAKGTSDAGKLEYCLNKINEASLHLLGMINDILDMSKIDTGKMDLIYSEFDFERMLKRVTGIMGFRIDEKTQNFIVRIEQGVPPRIVADEQRLTQVLTNLLSNAVKFTPNDGNITLAVKKTGEKENMCTLRFDVIDSGIGISAEQQRSLFTLFEQADGTIARKFGGIGLGLAVSKSIVELMGGEIWVESSPGKGSDFSFEVTVEKGKLRDDAVVRAHWENLRILAVDDSWEMIEYFKEYAEVMKIHCVTASSGEEAITLMENSSPPPFDIIFVDWKMPGMNGIELTAKIREKYGREVVVVMISAAEWDAVEDDAKKSGIDGFIPKPLFPSVLTDTINKYINRSGIEGTKQNPLQNIFKDRALLLAEDMEINREIVISLLEDTGITIDCATNGAEALRMFEQAPSKYGVILMDIHMPEMDGYEATRRIRASSAPGAKTVPIIAMTANIFKDDVSRCFESGMNDHLGKPVDLEELMKRLRNYLLKG